jgi:hypothetical protein
LHADPFKIDQNLIPLVSNSLMAEERCVNGNFHTSSFVSE